MIRMTILFGNLTGAIIDSILKWGFRDSTEVIALLLDEFPFLSWSSMHCLWLLA